jgi:hypothetical protein
MSYKLGKRSLEKLEGVDERMAAVVRYAISVLLFAMLFLFLNRTSL